MKVIIATSTSSVLVLVFLVTSIYIWRLMGRIKDLHIILEGEIALVFFKSIFLTKTSSIKKILNANTNALKIEGYQSK